MKTFKEHYKHKQTIVDEALESLLPSKDQEPRKLHEAMRYSVLAGGKRVRSVLCLASCEAVGTPSESIIPFACALELIHSYSLIHDDLPDMDNDDLRRGRSTNHKVYGEAVAILTGDALLTLAFEWMSKTKEVQDNLKIKAIGEVAKVAGSVGMVGGQVADLESEGKKITPDDLKFIHIHKTAKLIQGSVKAGAILGGASDELISELGTYGHFLGLAFQLTDDLLDVEGDENETGKAVKKDAKLDKATYPSFYGVENTKKMVSDLLRMSNQALLALGDRSYFLAGLTEMIEKRKN